MLSYVFIISFYFKKSTSNNTQNFGNNFVQFFLTKGLTKSAELWYTVKFGLREACTARTTPGILFTKNNTQDFILGVIREEVQMTFAI